MLLLLSRAEAAHIAYTMNERALRTVEAVSFDIHGLRMRFVSAALPGGDGPFEFALSRDELRALDTLLTDGDPRGGKLPDGEPVLGLVEKLWRCMLAANGGSDANRDEDYHLNANPDDREAVHRP